MNDSEELTPWEASDGTMWMHIAPGSEPGWTGWQPGEDGVWILSEKEFRQTYPEAPKD